MLTVGQKINQRLTKQIDRCSKQLKKLLNKYNSSQPNQLDESDIYDVSSPIYKSLQSTEDDQVVLCLSQHFYIVNRQLYNYSFC